MEKTGAHQISKNNDDETSSNHTGDWSLDNIEKGKGSQGNQGKESFDRSIGKVSGWRFWGTMCGLYLGIVLVMVEMTIVNTALVTIANELQDFGRASWVINSYLLTWSGCLILWTQFSHTIGRKPSLLTAVGFFVAFSAGCGAAQTSVQLIILRAFQGLAGAGVFQLPMIICSEIIPPSLMPKYTGFLGVMTLISFGIGPLVGGSIVVNSTWRWIFLLNVPLGTIAFVIDAIAIPNGVPHHLEPKDRRPSSKLGSLKRLDMIGAILFLTASVSIVAVLQEVVIELRWSSPIVICLLVLSTVSWCGFTVWERLITISDIKVVPLISWKFTKRRPFFMFVSSFLIGMIYIAALVMIPLELQVVQGQSPFETSINLLPYIILVPAGSVLGSFLQKSLKMNATIGMLIGAFLQLAAAIAFVVVLSHEYSTAKSQLSIARYVLGAILGLGVGFAYTVNLNGMPFVVDGDRALVAPAMGATTEFRYLGGAFGLGLTTMALNTVLRPRLADFLPFDDVTAVMRSSVAIKDLSQDLIDRTVAVFAGGILLQWKVVCGAIGAQILAALLTW